eukprot:7592406-Alexandrium_andersonii.AAC.1
MRTRRLSGSSRGPPSVLSALVLQLAPPNPSDAERVPVLGGLRSGLGVSVGLGFGRGSPTMRSCSHGVGRSAGGAADDLSTHTSRG